MKAFISIKVKELNEIDQERSAEKESSVKINTSNK